MTKKEVIEQECRDHFNEPALFHPEIVRIIGFAEDDTDYYYIVKNRKNEVEWVSACTCLIFLDRLKGQNPTSGSDDFTRIDYWLDINGCKKESEFLTELRRESDFEYLANLYDDKLVQINDDKITFELIQTLRNFLLPSWSFLVKRDFKNYDLPFYFCLAASMNGGFFYNEDDTIKQWNINGSGSSAYLEWLETISSKQLLPGIDVFNDLDDHKGSYNINWLEYFEKLGMNKQPLYAERAKCVVELSCATKKSQFNNLMAKIFKDDKLIDITFDHVKELGEIYPLSFGDDPFLKKAQLVFCFISGYYLNNGYGVDNNNFIPSDYQIPNILEYLGILTYSPEIKTLLCSSKMLDVNSPEVNSIRFAAIKACRLMGTYANVSDCVVDAMLFTTYRKDPNFQLMKLPPMKCNSLWF